MKNIFARQEYKRVARNDSIESLVEDPTSFEKTSAPNVARRRAVSLLIAFATVVVFVALDFTIRKSMLVSSAQRGPPFKEHCGSSREEAISLGCTFDQLTASWLPASCSRKWADEFVNTIGVGYYPETFGKEAIDYSELPLNSTYYTTRQHHIAHCIYLFLRLGDMQKDVRVDRLTLGRKHQKHCIDLILKETQYSPFANIVQDPGHVLSGACCSLAK